MDARTPQTFVDHAALTSPVRKLLGSAVAEVVDWETQPITYATGHFEPQGLFRVTGHARDHDDMLPWTLVVKVIRPPAGTSYAGGHLAPERLTYGVFWASDPLAYQSGLLDDLPGIAAPRCYGVTEAPDGAVWLWLEELRDDVGRTWPLERFGLAARHFGRFNGAYLAGKPLPAAWWLSHGRSGSTAELSPRLVYHDCAAYIEGDDAWNHPLIRRSYPVPVADRLRQVWADDDLFYAALRQLPRTMCHFDAFRPNLFARKDRSGHDQTIAVDWQFVGIGGVAEELGAMVFSSLLWFEAPGEQARDLGETAFEGYLEGLRDAGWTGDAGLARLGYTISAARLAVPASGIGFMVDDAMWERVRGIWGRPLEELAYQWSLTTYYILDLAAEARGLMHLIT